MPDKSVRLSVDAAQRTRAAVLAFESDGGKPPGGSNRGGSWNRPPIRGILLDDLEDDGVVDMAVTVLNESTEIQQISLLGDVLAAGKFKLKFKGQTTADIDATATAEQVQVALEKLETIGRGNVFVQIGRKTSASGAVELPGIFLVRFQGRFAGVDVPMLEPVSVALGSPAIVIAATTHWEDSGQIESVRAVIPVGEPTPLRAGALAVAIWHPGGGYSVVACEPRFFESPY